MKKLLLLLSLLATTAIASYGQTIEHPKNILGIRAGVSITSISFSSQEYNNYAKSKAGFSVEIFDQIRLSKKLPFYLETGIFAVEKGMKSLLAPSSSFNSYYYVGVPLVLNYRWAISKKFVLEPQLGFYYAFLAGASLNGTETVTDFTGINRSDFGLRVGVSAIYNNHWSLRLGYDAGFLSIAPANNEFGLPSMTNGAFTISLGFSFNPCK